MADQNNPWDTTPAADSAAQSADAWGTPATAPTDGGGADWARGLPAALEQLCAVRIAV